MYTFLIFGVCTKVWWLSGGKALFAVVWVAGWTAFFHGTVWLERMTDRQIVTT